MAKCLLQWPVFGCLLYFTSHTQAAPPPLPPEKMWEYSDAIVVVDTISVTNTGEKSFQDSTVYSVELRVREVRKGDLAVGHVMVWEMADYQVAPGDYGGGVSYAGERLLLYLRSYPNGTYNTWGHYCVETIVDVPEDQRALPKHPGETIYAPGYQPSETRRGRAASRREVRRQNRTNRSWRAQRRC